MLCCKVRPNRKTAAGALSAILLVASFLFLGIPDAVGDNSTLELIAKMKQAFAQVTDYRTLLDVTNFGADGKPSSNRMRYAFKKPDKIRIDMISPDAGMTIAYPSVDGKALVKPSGLLSFFTFHLSPDSPRLELGPGQSLLQMDLGFIIDNMARSLTEWRRGEVTISASSGFMVVKVVSRNHFAPDRTTGYTFRVDTSLWLPVGVEERNEEGTLTCTTVLSNLTINTGIEDDFFDIDSGWEEKWRIPDGGTPRGKPGLLQ